MCLLYGGSCWLGGTWTVIMVAVQNAQQKKTIKDYEKE